MRYVVLTMALLATTLAAQGFAEPITVLNPSFEDGVTDYSAPPDNWLGAGALFKSPASTGSLSATATDDYVGQVNAGNFASAFGYQNLSRTFVEGTTYTLTVDVGMRSDRVGESWYADSVDWAVRLNAAGVANLAGVSGAIANNAVSTGFLTTKTIQYVATASDVGRTIQIELFASTVGKTSPGGTDAYGFISFDNVQLSGVAVPEPGAITLLSAGLIALLAYAWRKRK